MRIQAQHVKSGDRVRGLGLVVEFSEPETDHTTRLEGHVSQRHEDGGQHYPVGFVLPNEHLVNVRRSDENFRADRVEAVRVALEVYNTTDDEDTAVEAVVESLTRVANMPRHRYVPVDAVVDMFVNGEVDGTESAEEILTRLDTLADEPVPFD